MKKLYKKIMIVMFVFILGIILYPISCNAATATITASKKEVNVGEQVTITVNSTACICQLKVSGAGISDSIEYLDTNLENKSDSKTYTLDTTKPGVYKISLSGAIVDADKTESNINTSVEVKVNEEKKTEDNQNNTGNEPNTDNNNTSNTTQLEQTPTQTPEKTEPTFSPVNETVYAIKDSVTVRGACSTKGGQYGTLKMGESVERIGISTEKIDGYTWSKVNYNGKTAYIASSLLSTTKPEEKSSVKNLKSLVVEDYELEPQFNPETKNYSIALNQTDTTLNIKAIPEDDKATVNITGNEKFKVGNNIVKITVTAEDGTSKIYTITVSKTNEDGNIEMLKLSKLEIAGVTLEPAFTPEITNYVVIVDDPTTITEEKIVAVAEDEKINVTIAENEQSEDETKLITIMLESADGKKTGVYQITVKKPTITQMAGLENGINNTDNTIYYILGGIISVLLILIIIIIIVLKKTAHSEEDDLEYRVSADELSDEYDVLEDKREDFEDSEFDDDMIEQSNFKSQILNDDIKLSDDEGFDIDVSDDYKPNFNKKKGKHF